MHAEIIAIGTELTTGAKLDTNSQWLSLELQAVGIPVHYHVTVADDLDANVNVFRSAIERSDIVLISGGLGPTLDDLTRDVLAKLTGTKLVLHEPSLEIIRGMFARRNREMPDRNIVQAMFPSGSEPIPNRRGTAPGIYMEIPRQGRVPCRLAAMPGVPSEMKVMFHDDVLPRIKPAEAAGLVIRTARINCFGLGESAAEQMLGDVTARGRDPEVGITVHEATITLRIVATTSSVAEALDKIAGTKTIIYERMGDYAFGEEDDELEHVVVRMLSERAQTLAIVESATGGLVSHRITSVAGHELCFKGSLVALDAARLWFSREAQPSAPPGGSATPSELAQACLRHFGADWALSVGKCSRNADTEESAEAPIVPLALAGPEGTSAVELNVAGDPAIVKSRVAKSALNLLRLKLLKAVHR
ncbi:MAG TPA: CinA family nicotinamide mononucleotide deamidase-related protein [Pirellulaceae bacterium]|nr:CinA family nicotinamide mononucleotide deamidase-related protein [Pirellulaceae bacterium]